MAPSDYVKSRELASQNNNDQFFTTLVDGRPYLPNLIVDATDTTTVNTAALLNVIQSVYIAAKCHGAHDVDMGGMLADKLEDHAALISALQSMSCIDEFILKDDVLKSLTCTKVTGGITNALFRVTGFASLKSEVTSIVNTLLDDSEPPTTSSKDIISPLIDFDSVLIRIFGAEGMINRDVETSTYAALCNADIAYRYLGRFKEGRIEGWLDGFLPLKCTDLIHDETSLEIAKEMARLHCLFKVPEGELRNHHFGTDLDAITVGLWDQLSSWMEQARGYSEFKTPKDTERVKVLQLGKIESEVENFITSYSSASCKDDEDSGDSTASMKNGIVFCHNDLLAANIMRHPQTNKIQLIDFEYGGTNYAAFDIANHFNEHAGGTSVEENGETDYTRFPSPERQKNFCKEYVRMAKHFESMTSDLTESSIDNGTDDKNSDGLREEEVASLMEQVQKFILVNHLYWGLWAVNQAAEEGCDEFDYINYATNRFKEFRAKKDEWEKKT